VLVHEDPSKQNKTKTINNNNHIASLPFPFPFPSSRFGLPFRLSPGRPTGILDLDDRPNDLHTLMAKQVETNSTSALGKEKG